MGSAPAQVFVGTSGAISVGEYDATTGAPVNPSLVTGAGSVEGVAVSGTMVYVATTGGTVGEYDAESGSPINASLITGAGALKGLVVSGGNLYVVNTLGTVGVYDATTGAAVNASLVTGISTPFGLAVSGSTLYVVSSGGGTVGEYNATTGAVINASLVTGLSAPEGIAVSGPDLFVTSGNKIGEYNASTGAVINASLITGLSGPRYISILGSDLYVTNTTSNTVGEYTLAGGTVNASLITGLTSPTGIAAVVLPGADVGGFTLAKVATYDQTGFTSPTADPRSAFQFAASVNSGSIGSLLPYSSLTQTGTGSGSIMFQANIAGLTFAANYNSQAQLDNDYTDGTYNATIQTSTPNTYSLTANITGDAYPPAPQLTSVTNANWSSNGVLQVVDPSQPIVFTWTPGYATSQGNVVFEVGGTPIGTSLPADGTSKTFTIPGNSLPTNIDFECNIIFDNVVSNTFNSNIETAVQYSSQLNFIVQTGTPTPAANTINSIIKNHVLVQTSANGPVNGTGSNAAYDAAPYNLLVKSNVAGTVMGPAPLLTTSFNAGDLAKNTPWQYESGPITDLEMLGSLYADGTYTFIDGESVALTGGGFPNAPAVTAVNGAAPVWNTQGQLVLNPAIANTITWTPFSITATAFATNGHESASFGGTNGSTVNVSQVAGLTQASTVPFNTLTIAANQMTMNSTYVGEIDYTQAPSVVSPSTSVFDIAAYQTENFFTAVASAPGTAPQTINFPAIGTNQVAGTNVTLIATASSGLPVSFSIVTGPATVSGNVLNFTGSGTVNVQASQAGNTTYAAATPIQQTFTVSAVSSGGIAQTINFPAVGSTVNAAIPITLTATSSSGLPVIYSIASGPATVSGNIVSITSGTGTGSVTVNADQPGNGTYAAAPTQSTSFSIFPSPDISRILLQKTQQYSQSSPTAPVLQPRQPYQFQCNIIPNTGTLLPTSTFSTPGGVGQIYQAGSNGLSFEQNFVTKATMDATFAPGTYNFSLLAESTNTYSTSLALPADNYPTLVPQITSVTNATWSGGHLVVTDTTQPVVFTWPAFNSAVGSIFFQVNAVGAAAPLVNQTFPANGTQTTYTLPANSLTGNSFYSVSLSFQNATTSTPLGGVVGTAGYEDQVQFTLQAGTPTPLTSTFCGVSKDQVLQQTSSAAPVPAPLGDIIDAGPYNLLAQSPTSGSITVPGTGTDALIFSPDFNSDYGDYIYSSGSIASLATLNSTFPDGSYTLADGHTAAMTGDVYTNAPQILQVNGAAPIWNAQGQLVLDPTIANTITWSAINQTAGTFATNCHENAKIHSDNDSTSLFAQQSGVGETSTTSFNTATIASGSMIATHTYDGFIDYFLASSVSSPTAGAYDFAGYDIENTFTIVAQVLPPSFNPTFSGVTDIGVTSNGYIATGSTLVINLSFAPTASTVLTVINNTGSGPITGTFSNVPEGGTVSATFASTTYNFTATYHGGDGNDMTLTYSPPQPPSSLTILHNFQDGSIPNDGAGPTGTLVQGSDGNFYGTTINGGPQGVGSIFKVTPSGQVTVLYLFTAGNDGSEPNGLIQGTDGNFYGTAVTGGNNNNGTVFKITPQGQFTVLHDFGDGSVANDGSSPDDILVQGSDGNFYGATPNGGTTNSGVVYKITSQGQLTILHNFSDGSVTNDGGGPSSKLVQAADGNFYGTSQYGGSANVGTVYKISPLGQVTIIYSFGSGAVANDGAGPGVGLVQGPDGNFYGTTNGGGIMSEGTGFGTVFKVTPQGQYTLLHRFNDGSVANDGELPEGCLALGQDGNYYGTTQEGGSGFGADDFGSGAGCIYRITPQGVVTILHSFNDGTVTPDGGFPDGSLVQASDGTFYGTTENYGSTGAGVIYKFSPGVPVITSSLTANGTAGLPFTYQTLATNIPTIYAVMDLPTGLSINPATGLITGTPTTPGTYPVTLTVSNNKGPSSVPLTINIVSLPTPAITSIQTAYGTVGTFLSYVTGASNAATGYSATGLPPGLSIDPTTGIISGTPSAGSAGTYMASVSASNATGSGSSLNVTFTIFNSPPMLSQEYNVVHAFDDSNPNDYNNISNSASSPNVIFQGFDGTFYGVSSSGGSSSSGTIFNITKQGVTSVFHSFLNSNLPDGATPQGLLQAADGNFYGITQNGGAAGLGTIFKFGPDGSETLLHSFGDGSVANDGASAQGQGLTQGTDGNFYGATYGGGAAGFGVVFKMTPLGVVTILHSFGDGSVTSDGKMPEASLLQGIDGNFYGTTSAGGTSGNGTVFKITTAGVVTILHSFADGSVTSDGTDSTAPLIERFAGNFYGTTLNGGAHSGGVVFQISSTGAYSIVHNFGDPTVANDGSSSQSPLVLGYDGNFYGMTVDGGANNKGTVFQMTTAGGVTIIHSFGDSTVTNDGSFPTGVLYQDANGNFYGTTSSGGIGYGTVFSIVSTQPTTHVPIFTGATTQFYPAASPISFTPKALFGISSTNVTASFVQPTFVSQLIHTFFSQASDWTLTGTLPQFLTFDSTSGTISGTPVQAGVYTITMTANNATGAGTPQTVTLYIDVAPGITSATTAAGSVGTPFTYQIAANASPTAYGATGLPGWLSVNTTTGVISGTPPGSGTYIFSPTALNVSGTGTQQVTMTVANSVSTAPSITSATSASGTVGTAFNYQIAGTNTPTSFSAVTLPAGLLFNTNTGAITGTPTTTGTYQVPIGVTNGSGTSSSVLTLTIAAIQAPVITSCTAITCSPSTSISYQITGTNSPTTFNAQGLPTGLTFNAVTGIISGTASSLGAASVSIAASNNVGTGTASLALTVAASTPKPELTSASSATAAATLPFTYQILATNSPTSYDASGLPPGFTINPTTGMISGTPTTTGTYNVTLYLTSSTLGTSTASLVLTFSSPSFSQWATLYPSASVPTATPKNDGVPNLLKYFYDINPTTTMSASDRAALPVLGTTTIGGMKYLTLSYREYSLSTGLTVNVLSSSDLKTWSSATNSSITQVGTDPNTGDMMMQAQVPETGTKQFVRINVTSP